MSDEEREGRIRQRFIADLAGLCGIESPVNLPDCSKSILSDLRWKPSDGNKLVYKRDRFWDKVKAMFKERA